MICIDCRYIRERPSGISVWLIELISRLPALLPKERFLLLRHPKAKPLNAAPNVQEVVVGWEANGPATMWMLPRLVNLSNVELYYSPSNILPAGLGMATVVTVCDVMWIKHPSWARTSWLWGQVETGFYRHGIWRALNQATRLCTISEASRLEISSVSPQAGGRTRVILQGVSEDFRPVSGPDDLREVDDVRHRYLPGANRYVLTVGQFAPYKNHERIVRAFARAFPGQDDIHLALVQRLGDGPKALGPVAKALGVEHRVKFLHGVPYADLTRLFRGAACVCHASLYEGFGNALVEGMASGVPVVASNRSSMPEVCLDAALLVDPENVDAISDAVRAAVRDRVVRDQLRERGLKRAAELTWDRYAEGYAEVFEETLAAWRAAKAFSAGIGPS